MLFDSTLCCAGVYQERNKPIEPPKKPEAAPFFLPTVPSVEGRPVFPELTQEAELGLSDAMTAGAGGGGGSGKGRVRTLEGADARHLDDSPFMAAVREGARLGDCKCGLLFRVTLWQQTGAGVWTPLQ